MNNIDTAYQSLLKDILDNGVEKSDRTGTGTISVFGRQIRHKMSEGFPLLTTKKMAWKSIVTELLWFLRGDTNIKFLLDYDCHIWDGDAFKRFDTTYKGNFPLDKVEFIEAIKTNPEFAKVWGDLGPIYGKQWRSWNNYIIKPGLVKLHSGLYNENYWDIDKPVDQIANLINDLKTNPDSRRLMVSAFNVAELDQMVLPPCHYGFQVYTRELSYDEKRNIYNSDPMSYGGTSSLLPPNDGKTKFDPHHAEKNNHASKKIPRRAISLMWNQRSVDTFLGLPFNLASYALLLEILAKEVNMIPDELIGNLGDVHLYSNHIEQAKMQILRKPFSLPKVNITERNWYQHEKVKEHLGPKTFDQKILSYRPDCFELIGYESHDKIKAPLSN